MGKIKISKASASRSKTFEGCSWLYNCKYKLKLPDKSNDGASRGWICHLILECLLRRYVKFNCQKYFNFILESDTVMELPSIKKLILKHAARLEVDDPENLKMIDEMIIVALRNDFYGLDEGGKVLSPEIEFTLASVNPRYVLTGFIDKVIEYEDRVKIVDYKTSKKKFSQEELSENLQAIIYMLYLGKEMNFKKKLEVEFVFLKFPKDPCQKIQMTKNEILYYEDYLSDIFKRINSFDDKQAVSNFAMKNKPSKGKFDGMLMCGFAKQKGQLKKDGNPMWHCQYKFPFDYYIAVDMWGDRVASSFDLEEIEGKYPNNAIIKKKYKGCAALYGVDYHPDKYDEKIR